MNTKVTNVHVREFGTIQVSWEVSDTLKGFSHRLRCGELYSAWCCYEHLTTLQVGKRTFAAGTQYWLGFLPVEEPFEIVTGREV